MGALCSWEPSRLAYKTLRCHNPQYNTLNIVMPWIRWRKQNTEMTVSQCYFLRQLSHTDCPKDEIRHRSLQLCVQLTMYSTGQRVSTVSPAASHPHREVFWDIMPFGDSQRLFRCNKPPPFSQPASMKSRCRKQAGLSLLPEDGSDITLRNIVWLSPDYIAQHPRKLSCS
jgi:hypothetical protein